MEAATLKSKKLMYKGILKKTIKNVICRPDPVFWPQITDDEGKSFEDILNNYKVGTSEFRKPLWSQLSQIPKKLRPKPPPITKVDGLIFGIIQCQKSIALEECSGILFDAAVNPKTIIQPLIELCVEKSIPILCLKELRRITKNNFGIPTTALGAGKNCLMELETQILEISKCYRPSKREVTEVIVEKDIELSKEKDEIMTDVNKISECPYLYRTDNKNRVFAPPAEVTPKLSSKFDGQNFIEITKNLTKENMDGKKYMKMIVKKIRSNPNKKKFLRPKKKKNIK